MNIFNWILEDSRKNTHNSCTYHMYILDIKDVPLYILTPMLELTDLVQNMSEGLVAAKATR